MTRRVTMASDVDISGCWDYGAFGREISMGGGVERRTKMNEWKDPRCKQINDRYKQE